MTVVEFVERERARLRAADITAAAAAVLIVSLGVVGAGAWLLGHARWLMLPRGTPLAIWAALGIGNGAVLWWAARRHRRQLARPSVAAAIEREQLLRTGALRGVIELSNNSSAIARRADRALVDVLATRGRRLAPALHRAIRFRAVRAVAIAVATLALLLWASPTLSDGLLAIRRPVAAWRGTLVAPLRFDRIPQELLRGEPLRVTIDAPGRRTVRLSLRTMGEGWRALMLAVDSATGHASTTLGPMRGDLLLVAADGRSATDTTLVRVTDRPFVGGIVLRAVYPRYLGRLAEGLPAGEPARIPRGTVIEVDGRASTALRNVAVHADADSTAFDISGQAFRGRLRPARSARFEWVALGARGPIADVPLPIEIELVPDSAPGVELVSPATDTVIATVDRIQLETTVSDDHGIASVVLQTVTERARGARGAVAAQTLHGASGTLWNGTPVLDLAARSLGPGDALRVRVVATDNSPWAQRGASRELVIRVPTMEERRSMARAAADSTASEATATASAQKSLEQRTEEASRERGSRSRGASGAKGAEGAREQEREKREMTFESAEKARALAQEQRELAQRVEKLKEASRALEEQLRKASALDSGLARQLREAQDLLRDALTADLLEQMKKLEGAARDLSGDQARDALRNLAEMQRRLREQLEKSAEMLKRAALEGAMETLKDEAQDIADQQRASADSAPRNDAQREQREQREQRAQDDSHGKTDPLADRADRLSNDVQKLRERLAREQAEAAAQRTASAAQHAEASEQRMRKQDARGASQQMQQAANDLKAARDQQVGEWKKELTQALDQSIQELLQMAREESALEAKARSSGRDGQQNAQLRGQQSAVQQGVNETAERLQREGQKSSLLSGRAQRAMGDARQRVSQATQQLGDPRGGQQAATTLGEAADALNRAAAALARDRERANSATSATGFAEMLQQMQEMARRQGSINAQAQGLLPLPGGSMSPEAQATARMLARQQRGVANQLDELGDAVGGERAGQLAKEARQIAEALEQTRVDAATVARQQQLFRRLLDAGRSLEKEEREDNDKREAKAATGDEHFEPGAADARGREASRYREPSWNDLRGLSADERRAILEYFKRINAEKP